MIDTKKASTGLVLVTRLWLDIKLVTIRSAVTSALPTTPNQAQSPEEIHDKVTNKAFAEMRTTGAHATETLNTWLKLCGSMPSPEKKHGDYDKYLKEMIAKVDFFINNDFFKKIGIEARPLLPSAGRYEPRPFALLSQQPLLCGILQFHVNLELHRIGIKLSNTSGVASSIAHLYNAVKQESSKHEEEFPLWKDLEALLGMHMEGIFIGSFPVTAKDYMSRFCLQGGLSASAFAANRRSLTRLPRSQRGLRECFNLSEVYDIFSDQYILNSGKPDATFHRIEQRLGKTIPGPDESIKKQQKRPRKDTTDSPLRNRTISIFFWILFASPSSRAYYRSISTTSTYMSDASISFARCARGCLPNWRDLLRRE